MAYVKTVWEDNKTPLDAANLNKIEEGIENAVSLSETNEKDISTLDGQVAAIEIGKQDALTAGAGITITDNTVKVDTDHVPYSSGTMAGAKASPGVIYNAAESEQVKPDWKSIRLGKGPMGRSIAVYNAATQEQMDLAGTLDVSTPIADTHATTKKYVDKYLPTVDSWVAGGTIPGAHTISLGDVTYSEKIPKLLVLDLNLNRSGSSGGTCSIKAVLEAHDLTDPQQKSTQQLFNESADGTEGEASITGKIMLEHDDTDSYFQWKNIYVVYDYYVGNNHVKHFFKAFENQAAYYGEMKLAITVLAMSERKNTVIKQYANKE